MIAATLGALRILDEGGVPVPVGRPHLRDDVQPVIYDALLAENASVITARAMCTDALRSRSPKERLLAAAVLVVLDEPADLREAS